MGPSLRDQIWLYGHRDDQIFDTIVHGRGQGMPAWGTKIPEEQIWKLVAYIKSMRTPMEPDAPTVPASEQVPGPSVKLPVTTQKPEVAMPNITQFTGQQLQDLAAYLRQLK